MSAWRDICTHKGPFPVRQVMVGHSTESAAGLPFLHDQVVTGDSTENGGQIAVFA